MTKPATVTDQANWYTKREAADAIGVSTKTIENYASAGKVGQALFRRPEGGPQISVFSREDVDGLSKPIGSQRPRVVPASSNGQALAAPAKRPAAADPAITLHALLHVLKHATEKAEKLFLTIPEAAEFSGLSEAYIRRACQAGTLAAIRDAGWKIKRAALADLK